MPSGTGPHWLPLRAAICTRPSARRTPVEQVTVHLRARGCPSRRLSPRCGAASSAGRAASSPRSGAPATRGWAWCGGGSAAAARARHGGRRRAARARPAGCAAAGGARWRRWSGRRRPAGRRGGRPAGPAGGRSARAAPAGATDSSTRESAVLTPCPPGPEERENRQLSAAAGTTTEPVTARSPEASSTAGMRTVWPTVTRRRSRQRAGLEVLGGPAGHAVGPLGPLVRVHAAQDPPPA